MFYEKEKIRHRSFVRGNAVMGIIVELALLPGWRWKALCRIWQ